jgi:hypothetical protein
MAAQAPAGTTKQKWRVDLFDPPAEGLVAVFLARIAALSKRLRTCQSMGKRLVVSGTTHQPVCRNAQK